MSATRTRRRKIDTLVARVAVVLAVLGTIAIGLGAFLVIRDDDEPESTAATIAATTVPATTTSATTTTTTVTPTTSTTAPVAPTTSEAVPDSTVAVTAAPSTTLSIAHTPTIPANPSFVGFGSHQVLADPLPSGVTYAEVEPAWITAKSLADLLAPGNWPAARAVLANDPFTDEELAARFGPMERMSLLLIDATRDASGFVLTLGVLSNEAEQGTTTVWCTEWYADASYVDILQELRELNRYPLLFTPEHLRNDPAELAKLLAVCA